MPDAPRLALVTIDASEDQLARLRALSPALRVERRTASEITPEEWRAAEVLYLAGGALPAPEQAPQLRWVQLHSAGANRVLEHALLRGGVTFTTTSGLHATNIAEYVVAVTLAWMHRLPRMLEWQARGHWPPDERRWELFVPEELRGKTLGVAGYGSIGREVARLGSAFGMRVLALHRRGDRRDHGFRFPGTGDPEGALPERFYLPARLHAFLAECDVVVIALPLTPETRGMFDERAFRAMKPQAFLVNIARGDVCDEPALVRALEEHWIAGAGLDVFAREPLPPESPLWHLPNVILSPHISGFTPEYDARGLQIFEENLRRYLAGEALLNVVDPQTGY